ncbi:MAG: LysM peptidoglycan-binding domain-containing protein [Desulfovermiculus sp.]
MRCILCCTLLCLLLAGCAHLGPNASDTPEAKKAAQDSADTLQKPKHPRTSTGSEADDSITQDPAQPLEEEVTTAPHPEAFPSTVLTPEEIQALQAEPEIHFQLDIKETDILEDYFIYYSKEKHHVFQRWLKRAERYLPYIRKVFTEKGLPQDLIFLPFAESGFNPLAYSHAGAAGLWQFMPATGQMFGLQSNWWVDERRDPYKATVAAAEYLQKLHDRFEDWYLVLAAYNAGGGHVSQAMRRSGASDYFDLASTRQLHNETCRYVPKFLAVLKIVRNLEKLGFDPLSWEAPTDPKAVRVPPGTDLTALADTVGLSWSKFQAFNPFFRRTAAPPSGQTRVYLPEDKLAAAEKFIDSAQAVASQGVHRYRIRSGDSWWRISRRFDIPVTELKKFNQARSNTLRPGQWILIPGGQGLANPKQMQASGSTYTVKSGDTLWGIANSLGVSVQALRQANPDLSPTQITVGQTITLPEQASTRRIASKRSNYSVKSGDTLWDIAQRFDLSLSTLIQANGLSKNQPLKIGTQLYIPDMRHTQQDQSQKTAQQARVHYKVQKGDNVWSIARKFGVSPRQVMEWNRLSSQDIIQPGDTLTIYR